MKIETHQVVKGFIFCLTTAVGLSGNILIILSLANIAHQEKNMVPTDIMLSILVGANLTLLLTLGLPHSLFVFGVKYFYADLDCKFNGLLMRASRVMTIGLTCLLSCYQGATLASSNPMWAVVKVKLQNYLISIISLLLILSIVSSLSSGLYPVVSANMTTLKHAFNMGYCISIYPSKFLFELIGFVAFARDAVFVILMALSSVFIIFILRKHAKQMKGKRRSDRTQETTAEQQASKMVVTFVTIYVLLFGIENIIWFCQVSIDSENLAALNDIRVFLAFCFSTLFPFVLIAFNKKIKCNLKILVTNRCKGHLSYSAH
ncbi:olfactory receptor class A-like protein 1 [Protopterus annectens]|uniref:olfactory receptor class A-like protein 1 n=1 Tax=Protopterus annectens TaxID=7888 RepID=UPI001CFA5FFB|nr:olfactory receptor class A-like protein 1 [Protopterus annectens]